MTGVADAVGRDVDRVDAVVFAVVGGIVGVVAVPVEVAAVETNDDDRTRSGTAATAVSNSYTAGEKMRLCIKL